MKPAGQFLRGACLGTGVVLVLAGMMAAYWWFYRMAPLRRVLDPAWCASHSKRAYWEEIQNAIHRSGWFHDCGFIVGAYGDKTWMEWLVARLKPGSTLNGCFGAPPAHADQALRAICNQDAGTSADAWIAWWKTNQAKSQEEWVAEGFRQRGVEITLPPASEQIPRLLALLAPGNAGRTDATPWHLKHNAFRCLRDSNFDPVAFALSNPTRSPEVEKGLREYSNRERQSAGTDHVSPLAFEKKTMTANDPLPAIVSPPYPVLIPAAVFTLLLLGAGLMIGGIGSRIPGWADGRRGTDQGTLPN